MDDDRKLEKTSVDRVREIIKGEILSGKFSTEKRLPSERKLTKVYQVSRITVRHALSELAAEGYLYRIPFKGTYVSKNLKSLKIQLIINPSLVNSFFGEILIGIEKVVSLEGNQLLIKCTTENPELEKKYLQQIREEKVDGLILIPGRNSFVNIELIKKVSSSLPVVLIDTYLGEIEVDYVSSDDITGGYIATKHLIELGCRKILHLAGISYHSPAKLRLEGYKKALEEENIQFDEELVRYTDWSFEAGYFETKKFLINNRVDGIFACSDTVAVGAFKAVKELGLSVPLDISIVGYGNLEIGKIIEVPLTTIDQKPERLGKEAYKILMERIKQERNSHSLKKVFYDVELIIRESCGIRKHFNIKK